MIAIFSEDTLKQEIAQGLCLAEIARKYNCSFGAVKNSVQKYKIDFQKGKIGGHNRINLTGKKYGSLTVIQYSYTRNKIAYWQCQCDCGKICYVHGPDLRNNKTKTCGCRISLNKRTNWQGHQDIGKTHWQVIVNNASQRSIPFQITIEDAWNQFELQNKQCAYTGELLTFGSKKLAIPHTASLDRIDNEQGYTTTNIQWVHKIINIMKYTHTHEEFMMWCQKIVQYGKLK